LLGRAVVASERQRLHSRSNWDGRETGSPEPSKRASEVRASAL